MTDDLHLGEPVASRAMRLAREDVAIARQLAPDAAIDDDVLEAFYCAGYEQALRDQRIGSARAGGQAMTRRPRPVVLSAVEASLVLSNDDDWGAFIADPEGLEFACNERFPFRSGWTEDEVAACIRVASRRKR